MVAIPVNTLDTRDCTTWSCPHAAIPGEDFCGFCLERSRGKTKPTVASSEATHDARAKIMDIVPLLARFEIERERGLSSEYRAAVRELQRGMARAARAVVALTSRPS